MISKTPTAIPAKLSDDAEFARAGAILSALQRGLQELDFFIEDVQCEIYRRTNPGTRVADTKNSPRRVGRVPAAVDAAKMPTPTGASAAILEALALVRGEAMKIRMPKRDLEEAHEKREIISRAVYEQASVVDEIRNRKSAGASLAAKAEHDTALIAVMRAAKQLAAAAKTERAIRARLLESGYTARDDLLEPPRLAAALWLAQDGFDSPLEVFRRRLAERGVWSDQ